jgi:hypothetical protein
MNMTFSCSYKSNCSCQPMYLFYDLSYMPGEDFDYVLNTSSKIPKFDGRLHNMRLYGLTLESGI